MVKKRRDEDVTSGIRLNEKYEEKVRSSSIIEMSRHSGDNLTKKVVEDSIVDNPDQIDKTDTVLSKNVVKEDRKEKRIQLKTVIDWGKRRDIEKK